VLSFMNCKVTSLMLLVIDPLAFPGDLLSSYILDSTHVMLSYELNCKNIISQVV
jgi:hypothetical protein